jgi:hypothetical protein
VALKLETYVQAKRNLQAAVINGMVSSASGVLTRSGLTRRLRELGALMVRMRGPLSCVVLAVEPAPASPAIAGLVAGASRASDAVGVLGPGEIGVVAPATTDVGTVAFVCRMAGVLSSAADENPVLETVQLHAGYAAVPNLKYLPVNPITLLSRAASAVSGGVPESAHPWIRRFVEPDVPAAAHEGEGGYPAHASSAPVPQRDGGDRSSSR